MSKFKPTDFTVHQENQNPSEIRVIKVDPSSAPVVKSFQYQSLKEPTHNAYQKVKDKFGPLAATDPDRGDRAQKDRRFALNPLLRDPLSVEQEERRVIEEKVRAQVQAMTEQVKAQAIEQGYEEGRKQGFEEAYHLIREQGSENLEKLDALIHAFDQAKDEIFRTNEKFVLDLIYRMAKMVILRELQTDRDYLLRLGKELINRVGVKDNIKIRINPDDAEFITQVKQGLEQSYGNLTNLTIETSSQVSRGGCQLETEWNVIDASIDTQLEGIYTALLGHSPGGNA